jgi:hypothetical protein
MYVSAALLLFNYPPTNGLEIRLTKCVPTAVSCHDRENQIWISNRLCHETSSPVILFGARMPSLEYPI